MNGRRRVTRTLWEGLVRFGKKKNQITPRGHGCHVFRKY